MSLSSEEYRDHLQSTSVRAGFSFEDVILPEERRVGVNGLQFRYLDWGSEGKRPILFLHGGALTAHTWDLCCLALRDDYHCLALDQRGHGDSDWAPDADYSLGAQREDVKGFAEAIGLDRFVLVGMSLEPGCSKVPQKATQTDYLPASVSLPESSTRCFAGYPPAFLR